MRDHLAAVGKVLEIVASRLAPPAATKYGGWSQQAPDAFCRSLALAEAAGAEPTFLDVGAGLGTMMLLAQELWPGLQAQGIEVVPEYVEVARSLGCDVELADALDYKHYGDYGVIFTYGPIWDNALQRELERRIHEQMCPGAVLIIYARQLTPEWEFLGECVWRKPWPR